MNQTIVIPKTFQTNVRIKFRDADPAGIMFFGNILGLSHDIFEEFLAENQVTWDEWFKSSDLACPIRHTEVDYMFPFEPGKSYEVTVKVNKVSQSSFTMIYEYRNDLSRICSRVQMIHTFVDQKTFQKADIPEKYRNIFERYL